MTARSPLPFLVMNTGSMVSWHHSETSLYPLRKAVLDMIFGINITPLRNFIYKFGKNYIIYY